MKEETRLAKEAEERGEEIAPIESAPELGDASPVSAADLVAEDTDRPIADNKLPPPEMAAPDAPVSDPAAAPNVNPPTAKRGRRKMTPEEKELSKKVRDALRSGKPLPNFNDLPGAGTQPGIPQGARLPRDYYMEACNLFIPGSMIAGKWLGEHWGVPIVDKKINGLEQKVLEPDESQKQLLANMARWLEYEQFPEVNARWGFFIALIGYAAPKLKTDPTPARLMSAWEWIRVKLLRREPNPKQVA